MKRLLVVIAATALTAGCAAGGTNTSSSTAPAVTQAARSRVSMKFAPAAGTRKVIISVDNQQTPPLAIASQPQSTSLADGVAVSIDCETQSGASTSGSSSSTGTGQVCTVLTLLPPGQYQISVQQLDLFNTLIADLNQFITLAAGTDFFGNFFSASPSPASLDFHGAGLT